jgi:hypothetical protein
VSALPLAGAGHRGAGAALPREGTSNSSTSTPRSPIRVKRNTSASTASTPPTSISGSTPENSSGSSAFGRTSWWTNWTRRWRGLSGGCPT